MKLLAVKLAVNLLICYFNGILCSDELETTKLPSEVATNSSCQFESIKDCQIRCTNTTRRTVVDDVRKLHSKEPLCFDYSLRINGISLNNDTLPAFWFYGSGNILQLTITDVAIRQISRDAFNSFVFIKLKTLKLDGFRVRDLCEGIFTGLVALQVLELNSFDLLVIAPNILLPCVELHILEIKSSSRAKIAVDGATGTSPLQNLEIVTIRGNNLGDTITEKTFTGLVQVRILDLSRNRITSIGPNSFDAIAKTLNMLNLRHNRLRKLVGDIFASVFLQADMMLLQISLEYNWWHCDCDLQPMQNILRQYPTTFTGFARCDTPIPLRNSPIQHVKLCDHNNHTTTTSSTTETISSSTAITTTDPPATTTTKPPKDQLITLKCMKYFIQNFRTYVSVGLQKQDKVIRLRKTFDKDHSVIIKDFPEDYILLWYEKASQSNQGVNHNSVNCFLNTNRSRTHNINMGSSWRKNKVHTFCMKPKNSLTMTPLNCVSFDTLEKPDFSAKMWMPKSFRFTAIVLMIVASILAVLMGIGIVVLLARKYPTLFDSCSRSKRNKCDNNDNDEQVSRKSSCQSKRIDRLYTSQGGCTDSRGSQESQFDYIIWQVEQQRISSISRTLSEKSVPPPLPPPHPNQLKRRSQLVKSKDGNDIYCELH